MTVQTDALRELVAIMNERQAIDVTRFFTPDFRVDDPGAGVTKVGYDGAREMIESILRLAPDVRLEILDMVQSGERVAVRWSVTIEGGPGPAMLAIYWFVGSRIARDWGISARAPWPET